jgi:hypothetical protein
MPAAPFKDKFVAFIDVMGFKSMIEAAERGEGRTLDEIEAILAELARRKDKAFFAEYGPQTCPAAPRLADDLDFEISQTSDCTIVSAEVSPAGIVNLVNHCWAIALTLLAKGVLVRGYITRGSIAHAGERFFGSGYHAALAGEPEVAAFARPGEKGTPFIEVDPAVRDYVAAQNEECVREMFGRYVHSDETVTAIFPFKRLAHSFIIAGFRAPAFNAEREKTANANLRNSLEAYKAGLMQHVNPDNDAAMRKVRHYLAALDAQIDVANETDAFIDGLGKRFPRPR